MSLGAINQVLINEISTAVLFLFGFERKSYKASGPCGQFYLRMSHFVRNPNWGDQKMLKQSCSTTKTSWFH